jgi:hypothetical protein
MENTGLGSTYLFSPPSVLSGAARLLDLGGTFDQYNDSATDVEADILAVLADWVAVGEDINCAIPRTPIIV